MKQLFFFFFFCSSFPAHDKGQYEIIRGQFHYFYHFYCLNICIPAAKYEVCRETQQYACFHRVYVASTPLYTR